LKEEMSYTTVYIVGSHPSPQLRWRNTDPFFQEPPEDPDLDLDRYFRDKDLGDLTLKTYDSLDLDVRGVMARSDLYGRAGKNQHAFCLSVGREYPYDVRVLANLRPDAYWMNTMLHEFGHAVYDRHINPKLPYFLRTVAHTCTTEAIALMMGSLSEEPGWLEKVAGIPREELEVERLAARRRADGLVFTRWALVVFNFERGSTPIPTARTSTRSGGTWSSGSNS
jgi:peptidyl-dipeptidase A